MKNLMTIASILFTLSPAAFAGFSDHEGTSVHCFAPENGLNYKLEIGKPYSSNGHTWKHAHEAVLSAERFLVQTVAFITNNPTRISTGFTISVEENLPGGAKKLLVKHVDWVSLGIGWVKLGTTGTLLHADGSHTPLQCSLL